jgi:hypothetical protein
MVFPSIGAQSAQVQRRLLICLTLGLFCANFALQYPGIWVNDSIAAYRDAVAGVFHDGEPPIEAWLWSVVRRVVDGNPGMLAIQLAFHWLGFALIADGLMRIGKPRSGWLVLLSGAGPLFLFYNGAVLRDVGMASALVTVFGIAFRYRITGRPIPRLALCAVVPLLAYGTLVRTNAVFALGPVLIYLLPSTARQRFAGVKAQIVLSLVIAIVAIPLSSLANRVLFGVKPSVSIQFLQVFDLTGIAYHTKDLTVLPPEMQFTDADLSRCYTPYRWDTLAPWGEVCDYAWNRLGPLDSPAHKTMGRRWLTEIAMHPVAYLEHRFEYFNSMLYFLVPAKHVRYVPGNGLEHTSDGRPYYRAVTAKDIRNDYVIKNFLTWPVTWLAIGLGYLWLSTQIRQQETALAMRALLISGITYFVFLLPIGISTEIRYAYWTIMAVSLAALISLNEARQVFSWRDKRCVAFAVLLLVTVTAGMIARLTNFTAFLH